MPLYARRRPRSVRLARLTSAGTITVETVHNRAAVQAVVDDMAVFGGTVWVKIVSRKTRDGPRLYVVLRYTSSRVTIGTLPEPIERPIRLRVRLLAFMNRSVTCPATINTDPASPDYLNITLNPAPPAKHTGVAPASPESAEALS